MELVPLGSSWVWTGCMCQETVGIWNSVRASSVLFQPSQFRYHIHGELVSFISKHSNSIFLLADLIELVLNTLILYYPWVLAGLWNGTRVLEFWSQSPGIQHTELRVVGPMWASVGFSFLAVCGQVHMARLWICITLYDIIFMPRSFVFLQLHGILWDYSLTKLPRGIRQQHELCLADHIWARKPDSPHLQWFWRGASVWLPGCKRWRNFWHHGPRNILWQWGACAAGQQWTHSTPGVSIRSLHNGQRVQHHIHQWVGTQVPHPCPVVFTCPWTKNPRMMPQDCKGISQVAKLFIILINKKGIALCGLCLRHLE